MHDRALKQFTIDNVCAKSVPHDDSGCVNIQHFLYSSLKEEEVEK